jgi:hypothetical protein
LLTDLGTAYADIDLLSGQVVASRREKESLERELRTIRKLPDRIHMRVGDAPRDDHIDD